MLNPFTITTCAAVVFAQPATAALTGDHCVQSPDGRLNAGLRDVAGGVELILRRTGADGITHTVLAAAITLPTLSGDPIGPMPITLSAIEEHDLIDAVFATRGAFSGVHLRYRSASALMSAEGTTATLDLRVYDRAIAWRITRHATSRDGHAIMGEPSSWCLPPEAGVWFAERPNDWKLKSYAGTWTHTTMRELATVSPTGPIQPKPLVIELPDGGYALLTEAALFDYPGQRFRATTDGVLHTDLAIPTAPATVQRDSTELRTPWRVALVADDLNDLVEAGTIIDHLAPAPDPKLFADTSWIHTGRSVWRWWSKDTGTFEQEREMIDDAAKLGYEFSLVDEGWRDWDKPWQRIAELSAFGRERHVGLWIWQRSRDIDDPTNNYAIARDFLDSAAEAGVAGVKIDFFDAEDAATIRLMEHLLIEAAKRKLMVNFHGCTVPTGWAHTYPNEVSREGIRGLELNGHAEGPLTPDHDAALPFTRLVVGHGDYTPVGFSNPGPTTWAHQLAMAVLVVSPMQVIAEFPSMLLDNPDVAPALEILRPLPAEWDESVVLPPSQIGTLAVVARRSGNDWYLGAVRGHDAKADETPTATLSFLPEGEQFNAVILTDATDTSFARETRTVDHTTTINLPTRKGSGLVMRITPAE